MNVLIVEDDCLLREASAEIVAASGAAVRTAAGVEEAWCEIRVRRPDALVLDLVLGEDDGSELLARIAESMPLIPTVVVSGRSDFVAPTKLLAAGVVKVLTKPIRAQALLDALREAISGAAGIAT